MVALRGNHDMIPAGGSHGHRLANQRLALAEQQLQAREASEVVVGTISVARLSLQNATSSNTAAQNIMASFPVIAWISSKNREGR